MIGMQISAFSRVYFLKKIVLHLVNVHVRPSFDIAVLTETFAFA